MPKVTFIVDGEEKTVEFEHGKLPYSNHGKPESFLDVSKHFDLGLEHACGGSCACTRSEEHTSELQSPCNLVCRLLLENKTSTGSAHRRPARCASSPGATTCSLRSVHRSRRDHAPHHRTQSADQRHASSHPCHVPFPRD